jgi:hypothetical protein
MSHDHKSGVALDKALDEAAAIGRTVVSTKTIGPLSSRFSYSH